MSWIGAVEIPWPMIGGGMGRFHQLRGNAVALIARYATGSPKKGPPLGRSHCHRWRLEGSVTYQMPGHRQRTERRPLLGSILSSTDRAYSSPSANVTELASLADRVAAMTSAVVG